MYIKSVKNIQINSQIFKIYSNIYLIEYGCNLRLQLILQSNFVIYIYIYIQIYLYITWIQTISESLQLVHKMNKKNYGKKIVWLKEERRRCSLSCSRHAGVTYPYWKQKTKSSNPTQTYKQHFGVQLLFHLSEVNNRFGVISILV